MLKLNATGMLSEYDGRKPDALKIFDAGIISVRLAGQICIQRQDIFEYTGPVEVKVVKYNGRIRLLELVLKRIHALYKGSPFKSTNKIRSYQNTDDYRETGRRLSVIRDSSKPLEHQLRQSILLGTGNCSEMAYVALALCQKFKLNPLLLVYESKQGFTHVVCGVDVNGSRYILDPWANILCEEKKFLGPCWHPN
ncbi:hypothetical protein ABK905_24670 [Acerihabitans sp. KWT182]|uniref:Transglutaminase-like domain-containing protein n=1 Tax=Acerihabitans sp. KWT182 TaxID=3157919 RepID=A0AAU7QBB9_9GAMM